MTQKRAHIHQAGDVLEARQRQDVAADLNHTEQPYAVSSPHVIRLAERPRPQPSPVGISLIVER